MIQFYYHPTPNPSKVALFLEEAGLSYTLMPVDISRGEQHTAPFRAINPNAKVPALVDDGIAIFDSSAILLYLARKTGQFMGSPDTASEAELLSWLMFVGTGLGPFTGQAVHFTHYAPQPNPYAAHRYGFEAERHWDLINQRLATHEWMMGDAYTIVDMSVWGLCRGLLYWKGEGAWERFPHVQRHFEMINARPAATRANGLAQRHAFKSEVDAETLHSLFRHGTPVA
jgi:GSH-dependent disulfide-bond oxidoreductase